jgi:hypothetical protein
MGGPCSAHRGYERFIQGLGGDPMERDHLEDISEDGKIILKWLFKK